MRTFKFKAVSVAISMALALALPFGVMAADGFGDGAATEDTWDDVEFDAPVEGEVSGFDFGFGADFEEPEFAPSDASDEFGASFDASFDAPVGDVQEEAKYFFYYNDTEKKDFSVYYGKDEASATYIGQAELYKEFPADCENDAYFLMKIDVGQDTHISDKFNYKETDPKYKKATGHKWTTVIAQDEGEGTSCTEDSCPCKMPGVKIDYVEKCTVCGKYNPTAGQNAQGVDTVDGAAKTPGTRIYDGHKWSDPTTLYLNEWMEEIPAADATEDSWVVTYKVCLNNGCDHVQYDIKRNSSLVFEGFEPGENVESVPEDLEYPLTPAQYNDILLTNCSKDGKLIATFTNYEKVEQTTIDTEKIIDSEEEYKEYTLFETPTGETNEITVTVPKHHTYKYKYVMKDANLANADAGMYVNILDADGNPATPDENGLYDLDTTIGASKYCVDFEIEKVKTTVCNKENHTPDKKDITTSEGIVIAKATPGSHFIKTELKYGTFPEKDSTISFADYNTLKKNTNLALTTDVTDCTKGGNGTAAYKCEFCKQAIDSTKVAFKIAPEEKHKFTQLEMTEVVEATCKNEGSYIPVLTCENCGVKSTGTKQIIAKTPHVYDNVSPVAIKVDGDIVVGDVWGPDSMYQVGGHPGFLMDGVLTFKSEMDYADPLNQMLPVVKISLTRKCTVCGEEATVEDVKSLKATVLAVTKEGSEGRYCKEGQIIVKIDGTPADGIKSLEPVSEEVTLRYYSSAMEYMARYSAHSPSEVVKSNEVEATETEEGGYDETITCKICEKVISQRHIVIPALGHTHDMVAVEAKEATCTEAGNIAYYECQKCGLKYKTAEGLLEDQLTDEEVVIPATGHTMELVEAKEPTCVPGHPAYYVCTTCTEMFNDAEGKEPVAWEDIKIEPTEEHTPAEPVVEQREDGVYSVVYCDRCGIEISAEPYKGETVELLAGPKTFNLKANKPNAGYMEFKLGEVEGAEKYRVSYRIAGTKPYTRQESDTNVVKITDLERGQVYDFTACAGDVLEDGQIQWGARALRKDGAVKYARRWYETVEQSKIAKKGTVITLEWTFLNDASKYEISIADNKEMKNAVTVDAAMFSPQIVGDKVQVSADITALEGFGSVPAGTQIKFYVRIRPYTMYDEKDVAGGVSNLRAKTIKF